MRLLLLLLLLVGAPLSAVERLPSGVVQLDHAEFVASEADTPPLAGWQRQALPDNWRLERPDYSGFAWYRLPFQLTELPRTPLALYLARLSLAGEIWLNGSLLTPNVRYDTPDGRMGSLMSDEPLYLTLPSGLFRLGENELLVRLQGARDIRSGLSSPLIGPTEALREQWRLRYALQVILPYVILVLFLGALAFLVAHIYYQRRFHLIQLAMLTGLLSILGYLAIDLPLARADQQAIRILITTCMYWWLCLIGYRLSGARGHAYPRLLHAVSLLTLAATLALWALGEAGDRLWLITWPHLLLRLPVIVLLLRSAWRRRSPKYWALGLSTALWLGTQVQSYLILMEWLPWDSFRWSTAGALPFCIVLLFFFAERFILEREEVANQQRIAIADERGRILQDMHDGMGAQLITALRLAGREDVDKAVVIRSIEESLQDMRLIVDSLDLTEHDLLPLLGNLRFRLEPKLSALGIRLEWDVAPLPELTYLTPASALAILRIVQEAINNAVQHANAGLIRISVKPAVDCIRISINDNGQGFAVAADTPHSHGLSGMRLRAQKLGARLTLHSDEQGTQVTLELPLLPPRG
ncbi:sensor histidine kinase [Pseudomonas lopnurensis]|uniref:sensor histidine kinase n=1 Tax=Pseudomonas lopnurensis TaxID=1477517 RepID=UPI00187AFB36|nr:ATP-binding protein [Pseudomonas lopnurensis]MBE7375819.1 hypothetical protein [Pseudomonas lopnurensis]